MKINFTKKEYQLLVEMLYIADWVINARAVDIEQAGSLDHRNLHQKLLAYSQEMGLEESIEYNSESNEYYETALFEAQLQDKYIDPYEDESFWDELIGKLAERDAIKQYGEERYMALEPIKRFDAVSIYESEYANEFEDFGLARLKIIKYNA